MNFGMSILFMLFLSVMFFNIYLNKHFLMVLLMLELFVMVCMMIMLFYIKNSNNIMYIVFIFMVMMVCGSSLGLSVLVSLIRYSGSDKMLIMNFLKW